MPAPSLHDQLAATLKSLYQSRSGRRRVQQQCREFLLCFARKPDDFDIGDSFLRSLLSGAHDEIADRASLDLGGTTNHCERTVRDTGLQAGGPVLFGLHRMVSQSIMYANMPYMSILKSKAVQSCTASVFRAYLMFLTSTKAFSRTAS